MNELILYNTDDGKIQLHLRVEGETIWLNQLEIAALFQTTKQNVSLHAKNIFEDGELSPQATVKESLTVQNEGERQVRRKIAHYNLDLILAIGYRVRSSRGVQFRQWASTHLKEFLRKGFVMDDERPLSRLRPAPKGARGRPEGRDGTQRAGEKTQGTEAAAI